jgi:hypothetical protein
MLRNHVGTWALLVLTGAAAAACSSSSGGESPVDAGTDGSMQGADAGKDGGKPGKEGGVKGEAGVDAGKETGSEASTDAGPDVPVARFHFTNNVPNFLDVPFPSDVYLAGGKIIDPLPGADTFLGAADSPYITHELGKLHGFSRVAQSIFSVDDAHDVGGIATIDPATLPADETASVADSSSVFLIDLSLTGAAARIPCRAAFHDDRAFQSANNPGFKPVIAAGPGRGVVLQEGHQYATVLTSRVKTTSGKNLTASSDFAALSKAGATASVYTTTLATANTILASALTSDGATIVDIAPFTTNSETSVLRQIVTDIQAAAAPTLSFASGDLAPMGATKFAKVTSGNALPAGFTDSIDNYLGTVTAAQINGVDDPNADLPVRAHNNIGVIGTGVFQANNYLTPANGYTALDDATFTANAQGVVAPDATHKTAPIWVTFFIPNTPVPTNGYPVVIVQHGLGESRADEPFNLANTFCSQGWMVAAIDSVTFGARAAESKYQVDMVNNFASAGGSYAGPDGLADAVGGSTNGLNDLFGELLDIGAIRDQFRQAEVDTVQLSHLLASQPDLSALDPLNANGKPSIDITKIAYFGNSLGGIQGAAAAAIDPNVTNYVLNVAGGGVMLELAPHAPLVAGELQFAGFNFGAGDDHLNESHPLMNLLQTIMDPGDPLVYAPTVLNPVVGNGVPAKNVLQIEVVYDEYVANESNEALARALGLGMATPNVGSNAGVSTLGMVQDPTTIPNRYTFPQVNPDTNGLIHDTPSMGGTSVLVQTMPGQHGDNFQEGLAQHNFAIPFNRFTTATPFVALGKGSASSDPPFDITCSYLQQQSMAVRYLKDAFAGSTPNVTGFLPAVRDFDGDGTADSTDTDPNNPNIH